MSDLEFSAGLDLSDAVSAIDDLAANATAQLSEVAQVFSAALAEISVGDAQVAITADIAPAEAEVANLVSTTDAQTATISVDADTGAADQAVSDLGSTTEEAGASADSATGKFAGFGESAALVGGTAALAKGEVGGLGEVAGGVGLASAGAVAGVAALGAGIFELGRKGIEATAAEQRFNTIVGETKDAVETINVGSLSEDLGKLALSFGSTDSEIKNSVSSLFQFALNSGATKEQAAGFSNEIVALSARAVSLNPALGTLSDVTDSLGVRIARGGRFAAAFGISLTAAEINAKALGETGKTSASDLTIYEKATAAAELASTKYGSSLGSVVAEGAKNAANESKSFKAQLDQSLEALGKPLVAPIFDAIRASLPDVVAIAKPLAEIGVAVLPAIAAAASAAAPPLQIAADAIKEVPAPALAAAAGVVILSGAVGVLTSSEEAGVVSAGLFAEAQAALSAEVTASSISMGTAIPVVGAFVAGYAIGTAIAGELFQSVDRIGPALDDVTAAAKRTADVSDGDLSASFLAVQRSVEKLRATSGASFTTLDTGSDILGRVSLKATDSQRSIEGLEVTLQAFRAIAEQSLPQAAKLADQTDHGTAAYRGMVDILDRVAGKQHDAKVATDDLSSSTTGQNLLLGTAVTSIAAFHDGAGSATTALKDLSAAQKEETDAITLYNNQLERSQALQGDVTGAQIALGNATQRLNESLFKNGANFDINTQAGRDNVSALQAQLQAADQLAEATYKSEVATKGDTQARQDADAVLKFFKGSLDNTLYSLGLSTEQVEALNTQLGLVTSPPPVVLTVDASQALAALSPVLSALDKVFAASGNPLAFSIPGDFQPVGVGAGFDYATYLRDVAKLGAAEGAYITANAGGTLVRVGEGGNDEVVVSPANIAGARSDLARLGVLDKLQAPPVYAQGGGSGNSASSGWGSHTTDNSVHVDTIVAPSPEDVPRAIARKQRAMQYLGGR